MSLSFEHLLDFIPYISLRYSSCLLQVLILHRFNRMKLFCLVETKRRFEECFNTEAKFVGQFPTDL